MSNHSRLLVVVLVAASFLPAPLLAATKSADKQFGEVKPDEALV